MSNEEEDHLRIVVREEIAEARQKDIVLARWFLSLFAVIVALGVVQAVRDSTLLNDHVKDGHPKVVLEVVYQQAITMGRIEEKLEAAEKSRDRLATEINSLKQTVLSNRNSHVSFADSTE